MQNHDIKAMALANGFSLKPQPEGPDDLHQYVYKFAEDIAGLAAEIKAEEREKEIAGLLQKIDDLGRQWDGCSADVTRLQTRVKRLEHQLKVCALALQMASDQNAQSNPILSQQTAQAAIEARGLLK